ncbi:reverse transcriptase domain-containing protein [Tanacetum coccineum]
MSSSSAHSTVTYTSESDVDGSPWAPVSPDTLSPDYSNDSEPIEDDPQEAEEEEELPAPATSILAIEDPDSPSEKTEPFEEDEVAPTPPSPISPLIISLPKTRLRRARNSVRPQTPLPPSIDARVEVWLVAPTPPSPPPSPLSPLSSPLPRIPSPPASSSPTPKDPIPEADLLLRKRPGSTLAQGTIDIFEVALEETNERVTNLATRYRQDSHEMYVRHQDTKDDRAVLQARIASLEREAQYLRTRVVTLDQEAVNSRNLHNSESNSAGGGDCIIRYYTYKDFLNCLPLNFKGTKGAVGLAHWFEKMESVFHISNCTVECQVKTVGYDAAYAMTWKTLMKMMTEAYCPRSEIRKLETKLWNLTVKGTAVECYTQRFQELILLCLRIVPDESDKVERYVGGLPDSIQGSVMASKPKMLQEAIELARSLMDQKVRAYASRQANNKRRMDNVEL